LESTPPPDPNESPKKRQLTPEEQRLKQEHEAQTQRMAEAIAAALNRAVLAEEEADKARQVRNQKN
jgi:hypothetical protein